MQAGVFGVGDGSGDDEDDPDEFLPGGDVEVGGEFEHEDQSDITDEDKRGGLENGEFLNEWNTHPCDQPQGENADKNAGTNDPKIRTEGHGGDHIIHAQAEIHDFDGHDGGPEAAASQAADHVPGSFVFHRPMFGEMAAHQVDQVGGTGDFQPWVGDDERGKSERQSAKDIRADDAPAQGLLFLLARQVVGHGGDAESIVHAQ